MATTNDSCNNIPLADDDTAEEITEADLLKLSLGSGQKANKNSKGGLKSSNESILSSGSGSGYQNSLGGPQANSLDVELNPDEAEEKERLISQVLELQNTLDDLSQRVDSVKEENLKLKSENQVLGQYIGNLMSASSVFQSTSPKLSSANSSGKSSSNGQQGPPPSGGSGGGGPSGSSPGSKSLSASTNSVRV